MDFSWSAYLSVCESVDLGWSRLCRRVGVIRVEALVPRPWLALRGCASLAHTSWAGFSSGDRDDEGSSARRIEVSPREHDGAVQYCSPMKKRTIRSETAMAADSTAPRRLRNFILVSTTRSRLPVQVNSQKQAMSFNRIVRDPSHMIKKDQLIAGVDATLSLGTGMCAPEQNQGLVNEQPPC
jgi:hypothetical protein